MAIDTTVAGDAPVEITLYNDRSEEETVISMSLALARLLAYADAWTQEENRQDSVSLGFSSTLAAMIAGDHPLCEWLRMHLALRGSAAELVTKGRTFPDLPIPKGRLTTSYSFRQALERAKLLARQRTLDVKHLMAAYPVVKAYHAGDFLRFQIDRRAWCLALADHLKRTEPSAEAAEWTEYERLAPEVLLPCYRPDLPSGVDLLGVGREVEAFSMLLATPGTAMPLSIGVFGAWGSGKSYFMARVEERVAELAQIGANGGPYLRRIAQVRFNAWHYSEGDVVSSLVDQIFRNLRFGPRESNVVLVQRRADVLDQVAMADQEWSRLKQDADAAAAEESRLHDEWQRVRVKGDTTLREQLKVAQAAVAAAEKDLKEALEAQTRAIEAAQSVAPVQEAIQLGIKTVLEDSTVAPLVSEIRQNAQDLRWIGANRTTIFWGIIVVGVIGIASLVVRQLRDYAFITTFITMVMGVIAAVAPIATKVVKLARNLSEKGENFQAAIRKRTEEKVNEIKKADGPQLRKQEKALESARGTVEALRAQVDALAQAQHRAQEALTESEHLHQEVSDQLAKAAARSASERQKLEKLTVGSLFEDTIKEAADTEVFRKRLGTLSSARTYFQRLSETMLARREAARGADPPALERIVLYIDDLDRCPAHKVRQVLQAVHLLLAFDLFACMVAVDPRWIIQCLATSPGVTGQDKMRDRDLEVLGGLTTASDYLEKIFQIPLWLRPVPPERRAALAATLLERAIGSPDQRWSDSKEHVENVNIAATESDKCTAAIRTEMKLEEESTSLNEVRINQRELDFLQKRVAPLLGGNSRALKRFVNTYNLVKAALSEVEFDNFAREDEQYRDEPYRVCMAQLALLATQREQSRLLAKLVDMAVSDASLSKFNLCRWLDTLGQSVSADKGSEEEKEEERGRILIAHKLKAALLPEQKDVPVDRFAFWFERTRRYSFYL